jgi:adenylosuccinate synthase
MDKIRICTAYRKDGKEIDYIPRSFQEFSGVEMDYMDMEPWGKLVQPEGGYTFNALPAALRKYVEKVEELLDIPVDIISLGEGRENTIVRDTSVLNSQAQGTPEHDPIP